MHWNGTGTAKDYDKAVKWYRLAAHQGLADAEYSLGISYRLDLGVKKEHAETMYWLGRAARQGHKDARYVLGDIHLRQRQTAKGWWFMCAAANQGHAKAQHLLGLFYEGRAALLWPSRGGAPVRTDFVYALMWYKLAVAGGV